MQAQNKGNKRILAIECAVGRGSLAILEGTSVLASSEQLGASPSRAEEILGAIDQLCGAAGIPLASLDLVAVSNGPGSYSGIRIGIATGLGLKAALNIPLVGIPVLEAIARAAAGQGDMVTAIPVGTKDVAWQSFDRSTGRIIANHVPLLASQIDFLEAMSRYSDPTICVHSDLLERLDDRARESMTVRDSGDALASLIGVAAANGFGTEPEPIYLRNTSHAAGSPGF